MCRGTRLLSLRLRVVSESDDSFEVNLAGESPGGAVLMKCNGDFDGNVNCKGSLLNLVCLLISGDIIEEAFI